MVSRKKYGDSCLEIMKEGRMIVKEWREDRGERKKTREGEGKGKWKRGKIEGKREVSPWREENSADFSLFYKFSTFFMRSISFSLTDCQEEEVTS